MNKMGHRVVGGFVATNATFAVHALGLVPTPLAAVGGVATVAVSHINDWDLNYYKDRDYHGGAALVRWTARLGYSWHTKKDEATWARHAARFDWDPEDYHRGPSHCLEWSVLFGLIVGGLSTALLLGFTGIGQYCWWLGVSVFLGTASHVCADALTPAGVPVSALYNWWRHGEVWKRHALAWRIPYGHVTWNVWMGRRQLEIPVLGWLRYPRPIAVDEKHPGCTNGIFYTDQAGEHLFTILLTVPATVVCALVWTGSFVSTSNILLGAWSPWA